MSKLETFKKVKTRKKTKARKALKKMRPREACKKGRQKDTQARKTREHVKQGTGVSFFSKFIYFLTTQSIF